MEIKLYLYDSSKLGYRGVDYSSQVRLGATITDDLTEVLGTAEITLVGLRSAVPFEPSTKFIMDCVENNELVKTWHICVASDYTDKVIISDNEYYDHHITFNEASVLAQGRIVDDIAVTYKLADITLGQSISYDSQKKAQVSINNITDSNLLDINFGDYVTVGADYYLYTTLFNMKHFEWVFPNWFSGANSQYNSSLSDWTNLPYFNTLKRNEVSKEIEIPIPFLKISQGQSGTKANFIKSGYCSVHTTVTDTDTNTGEVQITEYQTNPCINDAEEGVWNADLIEPTPRYTDGNVVRGCVYQGDRYKFKFVTEWENEISNRKIPLTIMHNHTYKIKCSLQWFGTTINAQGQEVTTPPRSDKPQYGYIDNENNVTKTAYCYYFEDFGSLLEKVEEQVDDNQLSATLEFACVYEQGTQVFLRSAPKANAYDLFKKAQLCSQTIERESNKSALDTTTTFYLEEEMVKKLKNTEIIESVYHQKNFWEILLDIGKYIHSIPKIEFGVDDRLLVKWTQLGKTDIKQDSGTKINIYNDRSIENYVSACSSYVQNMVQLGGIIDEWVAPKSTSEDYLVYNDTAKIIVSKPITEIVSLEVKCTNPSRYGIGNTLRDITDYVFENNVYELLGVTAGLTANKGKAIYYHLGTNEILGLDYQLPTLNQGDTDSVYAIKRILAIVYGITNSFYEWENIRVNDFVFHIVYRTKDTVRSTQTRPDLRKYLLGSKYDTVPQHNQFNNQEDILVDSTKLGNQVYGKLIKTGNNEIIVNEWHDKQADIKEVGDLVDIENERYYVGKVETIYYGSYAVSKVTYSKDYNQLSEIIGIPSEPRFYEISERSVITREKTIDDYLLVNSGNTPTATPKTNYINSNGLSYLKDLLFGNEQDYPRYAVTVFKNDGIADQVTIDNENFIKEVLLPISTYSCENTLTMEWDCVDNFSAGDSVSTVMYDGETETTNTSYRTLQPTKYTDVYGRSQLIDFAVLKEKEFSNNEILELPNTPTAPLEEQLQRLENEKSDIITQLSSVEQQMRSTYPNVVLYLEQETAPTTTELNNAIISQKIVDGDWLDTEVEQGDTVYFRNPITDEYLRYINAGSFYSQYLLLENHFNNYKASFNERVSLRVQLSSKNNEIAQMRESIVQASTDIIQGNLFGNITADGIRKNNKGIVLLKDNREAISINYNLQMLTSSDRFVLSQYLWQKGKTNVKIVFLSEEINKLSNGIIKVNHANKVGEIPMVAIVANGIISTGVLSNVLTSEQWERVKAIAIVADAPIVSTIDTDSKMLVLGYNVDGLSTADKGKGISIAKLPKNYFIKQ